MSPETYWARKASLRCVDCGRPADGETIRCEAHRQRLSRYVAAYHHRKRRQSRRVP